MEQQPEQPKKRKHSNKRHRQHRLTIRFNETEWQDLQTRADVAGLSTAGYSRAAILNAKPLRASRRPSVDRILFADGVGQLGKVGSNVNQLAKLAHFGSWPEHEILAATCANITAACTAILQALGYKPTKTPEASRDFESVTT